MIPSLWNCCALLRVPIVVVCGLIEHSVFKTDQTEYSILNVGLGSDLMT